MSLPMLPLPAVVLLDEYLSTETKFTFHNFHTFMFAFGVLAACTIVRGHFYDKLALS